MNRKIPAVLVGSKCVDWYSCIIQSNFKKATELKHELKGMIQDMEQDDKVISYLITANRFYRLRHVFYQRTPRNLPRIASVLTDE